MMTSTAIRPGDFVYRLMISEQEKKMKEEMEPWVLVEGPAPGSAEFIGRWVLAAVDADRKLDDQYARNPSLKQQISRLEVVYVVSFSPSAIKFIELLMKNLTCFPLDLWDEWGEMFTVMAELGFFSPTGNRYQMTIPTGISGLKIEAALLRLASTEDDEYYLHPEDIVWGHFLPKTEAEALSHRLECMPWMQRVADRELLLGGIDSMSTALISERSRTAAARTNDTGLGPRLSCPRAHTRHCSRACRPRCRLGRP